MRSSSSSAWNSSAADDPDRELIAWPQVLLLKVVRAVRLTANEMQALQLLHEMRKKNAREN